MKRTMKLCGPCAEKMRDGYAVKEIPRRSEKITCELCGKRRYGLEYEIRPKWTERANG